MIGDKRHIDWEKEFFDFLTSLTSATHGKQQYFEQDDRKIYSRISCRYLTIPEMEREYIDELKRYFD